MKTLARAVLVMLILALSASVALAQGWRGMGRMAGKGPTKAASPWKA